MLDKNHPVYREMREQITRRLATCRASLELLTTTPEKTSELRGRVDELKKLLDYNGEAE
jgi:hypothetical protein